MVTPPSGNPTEILVAVTTVRGRVWRHGQLKADSIDLAGVAEALAQPGSLVWIDLCGPAQEHLQLLAGELDLAPHAVEDAVARAERPKASRQAKHTFVTAYATHLDQAQDPEQATHDSRLALSRISAFVLPRALITVRPDDSFPMDDVIARWDDNADLLNLGTEPPVGALLHGLLDTIVDSHFHAIEILDDAVELIEGRLFDSQVNTQDIQSRVYRMRKELVELRRVVLPMREVVNTLLRHRIEVYGKPEDRRELASLDGYYEDLYDHVLRAAEWTESLRDMVTSLFETNLSLQDAHLNTVMKKLAGWAAIIAVPTAVTGWFGQNVPYPGFAEAFGMWQSTVLIVTASIGLYIAFRRRDWI